MLVLACRCEFPIAQHVLELSLKVECASRLETLKCSIAITLMPTQKKDSRRATFRLLDTAP